jgi:hypothetical protein
VRNRVELIGVLWWLTTFSGCYEYFTKPMSATTLAHHNSGRALAEYLSQPDASPEVCDMRSAEPHITQLRPEDSEDLVDGLVEGRVPPVVWRACVTALLPSAPSDVLPEFLNAAGRGYRELITRDGIESDYQYQLRLLELHMLYLDRPHTVQPGAAVARELFEALREAHSKKHLGPYAMKLAAQLLEAYDLEHGRWRGRALDLPALDELFAARDAASLHLILARSSSEQLRDEAKRRIIRLHIASSKFPEVKAQSAQVEETLMRLGYNPQDPNERSVLGGRLTRFPWQSLRVQQNFEQQTASLFGQGPAFDGASALPLRGLLRVKMKGLSRPITLCADASALDPTPCLAAKHVSIAHPLVRFRKQQLELRTEMPIDDAGVLARNAGKLDLSVRVAGVEVDKRTLPVRFESTDGRLLIQRRNARYGEHGPELRVAVDCPNGELLSFAADSGTEQRSAFVEVADIERFSLENHGAPGRPGTPGSDGSPGTSGSDCQDGGRGGDGGTGGPGGPGGDGGNVRVEIVCRDGVHTGVGFSLLRDTLQRVVHSIGGPGGPGGRGGNGGRGGFAGSSRPRRTHRDSNGREWVDDKGCPAGSSGSSGSDGWSGPEGSEGRPGIVSITSGALEPSTATPR